MKLTVSSGGVPVGNYLGKFLGVEPTENEYGKGLRWQFEIVSGPQTGSKASRITQVLPTLKNGCGRMLSGITGKTLAKDETIDLTAYVGKTYLIDVAQGEKGGTRIEKVMLPPTA